MTADADADAGPESDFFARPAGLDLEPAGSDGPVRPGGRSPERRGPVGGGRSRLGGEDAYAFDGVVGGPVTPSGDRGSVSGRVGVVGGREHGTGLGAQSGEELLH